MKKPGGLIFASVLVVVMIILLGFYLKTYNNDKNNVKNDLTPDIGEIWENYPDGGNPFSVVRVREVIDAKEGYIKYVQDKKDTIIENDYSFLLWSTRVK